MLDEMTTQSMFTYAPNLHEQSARSPSHICRAWAMGFNLDKEMLMEDMSRSLKCDCTVGLAFLCFCHQCEKKHVLGRCCWPKKNKKHEKQSWT